MTRSSTIKLILLIIAVPVVGYGMMHGAALITPMGETAVIPPLLLTLFIIAIGLMIPFLMLKLVFHNAHLRDPRERELHLSDMPKDQDQLERTGQ